jgi:RNA polymerase sigma-70 factor (ECF subfamily)
LSHDTIPLSERAEETVADGRMEPSKTEAKIDKNLLEKHLRSLKDEYREVLVMKYLDELETSEIADILGKNHGNVRVLLHRALAAVRELVSAENLQHETAVRGAIEGLED